MGIKRPSSAPTIKEGGGGAGGCFPPTSLLSAVLPNNAEERRWRPPLARPRGDPPPQRLQLAQVAPEGGAVPGGEDGQREGYGM